METDDFSKTMIKKYLDKHYKIHKIFKMNPHKPASQKNQIRYELYDNEQKKDILESKVTSAVAKIFSVDEGLVDKVLKELASEEMNRFERLQIKIYYEGNSH